MLERFVNSFRNIFAIPDLRKRVLFTLLMLVVYRVGSHIRTPGIDPDKLDALWQQLQGSLVGVLDLFSGGNFRIISIFALGITPYITASIILQLMTVVWPFLKKLQEEGEAGRKKINQYTRYLTIALSFIQSLTIALWLQNQPGLVFDGGGAGFILITILTLSTGTAFIMWVGEQITERGVGNGISLLIFAGIVIRLPSALKQLFDRAKTDPSSALGVILFLVAIVLIVAGVVFMERGHRKVPINYARRQAGRQSSSSGGQSTYMPLRVNMAGVIPVIFASSILTFPQTLAQFVNSDAAWVKQFLGMLRSGHPLYDLVFVAGIVFFTFFYVSIVFNVDEVAENLRKYGGFVPGIRPGKNTAEFLNAVLTRLTVVGAIYLAVICIIPQFIITGVEVSELPFVGEKLYQLLNSNPVTAWVTKGLGFSFYFGGTSLLIVVGVAMDTVQQVESQLIMRQYEGFLKKGRIRGRRG
jgi:preprotein translocase subunit SecY